MGKESVAILYAQPEMESGALSALLYERFGFPVIGGTSADTAMISNSWHHELSILLHVMTPTPSGAESRREDME